MRRIRRLNIRTLPRGAFKALCAFTLALCTVLIFDARLRPAVRNIAMTRAKSLAVRTVGNSIEKFISENPEDCAALVSVSGSGGKVNSMSLNAASVNLFKSRLVRAVDEALEENARFTVRIPLGSVMGSEVFAGAGPEIPVTVRMTGGADNRRIYLGGHKSDPLQGNAQSRVLRLCLFGRGRGCGGVLG